MTEPHRRLPVVAAIQMVSSPDVGDNLARAAVLLENAKAAGADLVLLPEYFCIIGSKDTDKVGVRESAGAGPIQECLANLARRLDLWILGGTLPIASANPARVRSALIVFNPEGQAIARYDKIHLFSFLDQSVDESRTIEPGTTPVAVDVTVAGTALRIGLSVCYDMRFPELYRALGRCDLIVVPSAFTDVTGKAHWEVLLRARAIENQCYVLAAAQGGRHPNGRVTFGHSMLIDPWGEVVAVLPEGEGLITGTIDLQHLATTRMRVPALHHRTL
jgi:nitrilase